MILVSIILLCTQVLIVEVQELNVPNCFADIAWLNNGRFMYSFDYNRNKRLLTKRVTITIINQWEKKHY